MPVIGVAPLALSPRNQTLRKAQKEVLEKLVEVHLPDSLLTIGNSAFAGCPELETVVLFLVALPASSYALPSVPSAS